MIELASLAEHAAGFPEGPVNDWIDSHVRLALQHGLENPYIEGTPEFDAWAVRFEAAKKEKK